MQTISYITKSPRETEKLARFLSEEILIMKNPGTGALCILLKGELGTGKTLFTKGLARGLGVRAHISSPTFVLMKRYPLRGTTFKNMWHVDCYRISKARELLALGFRDIAKDRGNIVIVEWPERIQKYFSRNALRVSFFHRSPSERIVDICL